MQGSPITLDSSVKCRATVYKIQNACPFLEDRNVKNLVKKTDKEIYSSVKKTYYNRDNKVKYITFVWACTENGRK